ncbi:hypothetical protein C8J57DRAFT_1734155 [Mycena rebaudengoi]|nr:hypothetical protein C8J57DRAFT_1734155 [Mycena rebaudengoi]
MLHITTTPFCLFIHLSTAKTPPAAHFLVSPAVLLPFCPSGLAIPHTYPQALSNAAPNLPPSPNFRPPTVLAPPIARHPNTAVVCLSATRIGVLFRRLCLGVGVGVYGREWIFTLFSTNRPGPREFIFDYRHVFTSLTSAPLSSSPRRCAYRHTRGPDRFGAAISRLRDVENPVWSIDAKSPRPQYVSVAVVLVRVFRQERRETLEELSDVARAPASVSRPHVSPSPLPCFLYLISDRSPVYPRRHCSANNWLCLFLCLQPVLQIVPSTDYSATLPTVRSRGLRAALGTSR